MNQETLEQLVRELAARVFSADYLAQLEAEEAEETKVEEEAPKAKGGK